MKQWGGAADGARPVRVHGHWTMPGMRRLWSPRVSIVDAPCGDWSLAADADGMLGWTAGELRGLPARDLMHPDDQHLLDEVADRTAVGAFLVPMELRLLARDSRYWWTRWHLVSTPCSAVEARGVDYVGPAAEMGLPVGTWQCDVDHDTVVWSRELLDMFTRTHTPRSCGSFLAIVDDDDRAALQRCMRRTANDGVPLRFTFRGAGGGCRDRWFHTFGRRTVAVEGARQIGGIVKFLNPPSTWPSPRAAIGCG
jgi:PAS domain-containing protein